MNVIFSSLINHLSFWAGVGAGVDMGQAFFPVHTSGNHLGNRAVASTWNELEFSQGRPVVTSLVGGDLAGDQC